jgi:hypothetical protein
MQTNFLDSMPGNHNDLEKRLWDAADELRANSGLKSSEYSVPVSQDVVFKKGGGRPANDLDCSWK